LKQLSDFFSFEFQWLISSTRFICFMEQSPSSVLIQHVPQWVQDPSKPSKNPSFNITQRSSFECDLTDSNVSLFQIWVPLGWWCWDQESYQMFGTSICGLFDGMDPETSRRWKDLPLSSWYVSLSFFLSLSLSLSLSLLMIHKDA
jgi:hypothetical protein